MFNYVVTGYLENYKDVYCVMWQYIVQEVLYWLVPGIKSEKDLYNKCQISKLINEPKTLFNWWAITLKVKYIKYYLHPQKEI